ncbi:nuclear transport factor 2 family protein [Altererythrobacter fulvus]|uniref:nuclear transport factor 2 family protein n=1 Tax=Caenibius fulvus TaxID=2126012 RepID=UPI00301AEDC2
MRKIYFGLAAACLAATAAAPATAREPLTAQAVIDKAEIEDLLTRYYAQFGGGVQDHVAEYYTADGEMVLGANSYKGIEAIKGAYAAVPADAPQRKSFALNILIGNPLINVTGDTATARLVFTEYVVDKQGDAPRILTMGREFDWLVKEGGKWLIQKRQIMGANGTPEGWVD